MTRELVLALDLGTTGVRALVVRADGAIRGRAWRPLAMRFPAPGHVEQDPEAWWSESQAVMRAALAEARASAAELAALAVVTQRATALAWEPGGRALAPAIGWQDARTQARVAELRARGIPVSTLASATKLEWLLGSAPAVRETARGGRLRLGTPDAFLTDRLTGGTAFVTDPGSASVTALFDLRARDWRPGALALFGIERAWLPAVVATSAVVGETPASLLGAPVPVAARAGDQQAAAFAQGVHAPGAAKLTIGTSAMLDLHTGVSPERPRAGAWPLALWTLPDGTSAFALEGTVITAGAALEWLVDLGLVSAASELDRLAANVASSEGVAFVPALQGLGTPWLDEGARGLWCGLGRATRPAHLARAVLEGVAQRCADLCEALALPDGPLRVDGGAARSRLLLGLLADYTGRVVERAAEVETTALGAAFLAGLATGVWRSPADALACAAPPERIEPRLDAAGRETQREAWRRIVARARG
ncbi:MAG TPA: FGGY family carbohydrate kinase [Myxococcota bacterium]